MPESRHPYKLCSNVKAIGNKLCLKIGLNVQHIVYLPIVSF